MPVTYSSGCLGSVDHSPTTAWVAAVRAQGGTVSAARRNIVDNLITGLQADGIYQKLDSLRMYAAENQTSALVNMVIGKTTTGHSALIATLSGPPAFVVDRGFTGVDQSTTVFVDSQWDPPNNGLNFTLNSAHFSVWCNTNIASTSNGGCIIGAADVSGNVLIGLYNTFGLDGNIYARINDNVASGAQGVPTTRKGHWLVNRTGASASQVYQNATLFASPNAAAYSAFPDAFDIYVLASNELSTSAFGGNPNQVAAVTIGAGLTADEINRLYNRINSYMISVGNL